MSVNGLDKAGSIPLHWAAHGGHIEAMKILLAVHNIQIDVQVRNQRFIILILRHFFCHMAAN